jgi:hypothetical protein
VVKVEGLRSYKAIAFIKSKDNPRNKRLKTKTYSALCVSLQKITFFSRTFLVSFRNTIRSFFNEKLGNEKWKK